MEIEKLLATTFILPQRRDRYVAMLDGKDGRDKWRRQLAHFPHWDSRRLRRIDKGDATVIWKLLRDAGAPETCYVFSEWNQIDAREMNLGEALAACIGHGMGTVLSCIPGRLAFYEAESPGERFILQR